MNPPLGSEPLQTVGRCAIGVLAVAVSLTALPATCSTAGNDGASVEARLGVVGGAGEPGGSATVQLFFTGSDDGYLDACGCDDGLLGGLPRRHTLLKSIGAESDGALVLSNGRLVTGTTALDVMKLETIAFAMSVIGYDALALTERELALGREKLVELAGFLGEECPLIATNLVDGRGAGDSTVPALPVVPFRAIGVGGREVLVLSAVATSRAAAYHAADALVSVSDPVAALTAAIESRPEAAKVVVLGQMSIEEAEALARDVARIDVLVVEGSGDDHPREDAIAVGSTSIVTTGRKGKFVGAVRFGGEGELDEFRAQPVVDDLDKSSDVQDVITRTYRDRLIEEKPIESMYERTAHASGATYVGADEGSCASCHAGAWEIWAKSKHSRAWKTLVDQDLPPKPEDKKGRLRNAVWDPDCVKCHVTGFGEVSGYAGMEKEKTREARLIDVTCEACHGPAGDHAQRAQRGDNAYPGGKLPRIWSAEEAAKDPAKALADNAAAEQLCMRCHDADNSPSFDLREFWNGFVRGEQRDPVKHGKD